MYLIKTHALVEASRLESEPVSRAASKVVGSKDGLAVVLAGACVGSTVCGWLVVGKVEGKVEGL